MKTRSLAILLAAAATTLGCGAATQTAPPSPTPAIAARAAEVMPFDLSKTTHRYTSTETGGVQKVTIDTPADTDQLPRIRTHLADEAARFRVGNYSDPARIHGMDMPGMRELTNGFKEITVTVEDLPGGARIVYATKNPTLVTAIHKWFDRQRTDHTGRAG